MATTHPPTTEAQWRAAYARQARARRAVHDAVGRADQAALHGGRPRRGGQAEPRSGCRASIPSRAASTRRCTAAGSGRCASSPASARRRRPTSASTTCSPTARPALDGLRHADADGLRLRPPLRAGEVGREGVAIDTLDDMETLFEGIDARRRLGLDDDQRAGAIMLAFYVAAAERRASGGTRLRGTIQTDILKEYIAQKEWCFPLDPSMRLFADMIEWCTRRHAALASDLDLRLPHPRGRLDGRAGARVHARGRLRLRRAGDRARPGRRRLRAAPVLLLQRPHRLLRGDRQVPRRAPHLGARDARDATARRTRARGCCASTRRRPACR